MSEPLVRRREIRQDVLAKLGEPIRESPVLNASLRDLMTAVRAQGLEGLVAKRLDTDEHVAPASVHHCIADASTPVGHNRTGPTAALDFSRRWRAGRAPDWDEVPLQNLFIALGLFIANAINVSLKRCRHHRDGLGSKYSA